MTAHVEQAAHGYPDGIHPYVRAHVLGVMRHRVDGSCADSTAALEALFARPDGSVFGDQAKLAAATLALAAMRLAGPVTADMTSWLVGQMRRMARTVDVGMLDVLLRQASGATDVPPDSDGVLRLHGDPGETVGALAVFVDLALIRMTPRPADTVAPDGGWVSPQAEHEFNVVRGQTLANLDVALADPGLGQMPTRVADLDARGDHVLTGDAAARFHAAAAPVYGAAVVTVGEPPIKDVVVFIVPAGYLADPEALSLTGVPEWDRAPQATWYLLEAATGPVLGMSLALAGKHAEPLRFVFSEPALRADVRLALSRTPVMLIHAWPRPQAPTEADIPAMVGASMAVRQPVTLYRALDTGQALVPGAA